MSLNHLKSNCSRNNYSLVTLWCYTTTNALTNVNAEHENDNQRLTFHPSPLSPKQFR